MQTRFPANRMPGISGTTEDELPNVSGASRFGFLRDKAISDGVACIDNAARIPMTNLGERTSRTEPLRPVFMSRPARLRSSFQANILYAEDDSALRELYSGTLARAGYSSITAVPDGVCAWNALHSKQYDLLITDNEMPRLTGLELVSRARLEGIKLPIIIASGSADCFAGSDYEWLAIAGRLQKPFARKDLLKTVANVLNRFQSTEAPL
jgi:CheY-like chemotaxis protein